MVKVWHLPTIVDTVIVVAIRLVNVEARRITTIKAAISTISIVNAAVIAVWVSKTTTILMAASFE